jgi:CheY-like chemotaxis protein
MMPIMSGDVFRQRQLADLRFKDIPVVCLTAAFDACRSAALNVDHCFQKPVDVDRLIETVRQYVSVRPSGLTAS